MLLQLNCRGFAVAQHMQPEPTKYSHAPILEQQTFIQPEPPLYAHHPGRFFYVRDVDTEEVFSVPHDPVRKRADTFCFSAGKGDVRWQTQHEDIASEMSVSLPVDEAAELWTFEIRNDGKARRRLQVFPYFTIGYMSWMNQSASYRPDLGGIVASSVTPYQKLDDYPHVKSLKDLTVLLHDQPPDAWEACRDAFEGEGGIHNPDSVRNGHLANGDALYETPVAALQYDIELAAGGSRRFRFLFAPARDDNGVRALRRRFLVKGGFAAARRKYTSYLDRGRGCLKIRTPDQDFDHFVNRWLSRQVYYHGSTNRVTTDPQTRNFLQDAMGMVFIDPNTTRKALCHSLSQQKTDGAMPEGIVLAGGGELKYINQIPHTDHCVWLPVCLEAYLDETADLGVLDHPVPGTVDGEVSSVFDRVTKAMRWLIENRDERGLSLIAQGDWCDPMNMVGHLGQGVSGWLTIATAHALNLWAKISESANQVETAEQMAAAAQEFRAAAQRHLWDGNWFARGISDDGTKFGISDDDEGRIFVNPQSWAIMADVATASQRSRILAAISSHLDTPYGTMMLAPAYTRMNENIGRVTQKHPGSAENGGIYNHASAFLIYAMYESGNSEIAFEELRKILPGPCDDDYRQRGQLPVFVPNYYRGAVHQFPRTAGRSSQMFNTGAASWMYRIVTESLFGLRGRPDGLSIRPALPNEWDTARAVRHFRGATLEIDFIRSSETDTQSIVVDGHPLTGDVLTGIALGATYKVDVTIPRGER